MKTQHNNLNSNSSVMVKWSPTLLAEFQESFAEAMAKKSDTFVFRGHGYTVGYASNLIRFLRSDLLC